MHIAVHKLDRCFSPRTIALCFFALLIAWQFSLTAHAGECLESDEEMYNGLRQTYEEAKDGQPIDHFGWLSQGCWGNDYRSGEGEAGKDYTALLMDLLRKMIKDPRLHEDTVAEAINVYGSFSGADDFLLELLKTAKAKPRAAILSRLMISDDTPQFFRPAFLKEYAAKETDQGLQKALLHQLARTVSFQEFQAYCSKNGIAIAEEYLVQDYPDDLQALDHLYAMKMATTAAPDYRNVGAMKEYFKYSTYIQGVLSRNLDTEFPARYLNRIRSAALRTLRNGIPAFYGKHFQSKVLESYFYGSYPYVQRYCKKGVCGKKETPRELYRESMLTKTDVANINAILAIEKKRQEAGYKEEGNLIENYDLNAFLKGTADNLTFAPAEIREIRQFKLDWKHKQIWIWDRYGISRWNLATGKRMRFIRRARGPLALSVAKRLLAYQVGDQLVLEHADTGEVVHKETVHANFVKGSQMLYYLPEDGRYFVFFNIPPQEPQWGMKRLTVINLQNRQRRDVTFEFNPNVQYMDAHWTTARPLVITKDNWLIALLNNNPYNTAAGAFLLVPLEENADGNIKVLSYKADYIKYHLFYTFMLDNKGDNLFFYLSPQGPINVYKVQDILRAQDALPDPLHAIDLRKDKNEHFYLLDADGDALYVSSESPGRNVRWFALTGINTITEKTPTLSYAYHDRQMIALLAKDGICAQGDRRGFVVITRF